MNKRKEERASERAEAGKKECRLSQQPDQPIAINPTPLSPLPLSATLNPHSLTHSQHHGAHHHHIFMAPLTVGVLALQGGVGEHIALLRRAAAHLSSAPPTPQKGTSHDGGVSSPSPAIAPRVEDFTFLEVRTAEQLAKCDALIIPGGESTTMAIVARRLGLLDPLRQFVKYVVLSHTLSL